MGAISQHQAAGPAGLGADQPQAVFVGDVQGCQVELDELLSQLENRFGRDGFVLNSVGDLVNRGPGSLRVLERIHRLWDEGRARVVLGNHELHLLMVALELRKLGDRDTFGDILESSDWKHWVDWLRTQSIARVGDLYGQPFVMVHASVHPDWDLDQVVRESVRIERELGGGDWEATRRLLAQDPAEAEPGSTRDALGRMVSARSVKLDTWSSSVPNGEGVPWHEAWSKAKHAYGVVYGHWALQGLHVAQGLRGLDTGCVHHGRGRPGYLTAWIPTRPEADRSGLRCFDLPDQGFLKIPAEARYIR
ncbi:metallophosphoesterase [Myxococcota bacterium]|nr:metallophosphoesterase [Myxococcota bacterium]